MSATLDSVHVSLDWPSRLDLLRAQDVKARLLAVATLAALSALPLLLLAPLFGAPIERDQGTYATIARGWMDGAIPYRDLWDNKGPLLFLWYAASFQWFGESIVGVRVLAAMAVGLSVPFVWATARILFGPREAALAAGLFAVSFANLYLQVSANAEAFMLLPFTAGLWAFAMGARGGSLAWFLLAGALTSLAVLTRQSAVWAFVGYGAWAGALFIRQPDERARHFISMVLLGIGGLLAAAPFVAYFAIHGALYDFWHAMFGFNFGWAAEQPFLLKLVPALFIEPGPLFGGLMFWVLALIGVWRLLKRNDRAAWLVISALLFAEAAAQTMGKGSAHYSIQLLPAAAIAAAVGAVRVLNGWRQRRHLSKWMAGVAAITLGAVVFAYAWPTAEDRFIVQYTWRDYADDAIQAPAVAEAVAGMSEPGDCVYEWGRSSQTYFLAERRPCTRWFHNRPFEMDQSMISEVMDDLRANPPAVIFVTTADIAPPPELTAYIEQHYRHAGYVEYARLYERT